VGLNGKERDRLVVLRQVKEGKLTQRKGAEQLGLSPRWVKKLMKRLRQAGDRGLAHGLRGRVSNRGHSEETRRRAVTLIAEQYADYGPTLASEMLARHHGMRVSRETLRKWMSREQLWKPRRAKIKRVHVWRPRREQRGELVQWDTSEHDWLEGRGEKLYLIAMIDDATSELTARLARHDSTAENMRLLWQYIEQHGRPVEVYTDKAGLFQVNRPLHYNKHLPLAPEQTQIKRALEELGIGRIAAHSPQAKGRVERSFGTMQDRLVKGLRRVGACTLEEANRYLQQEFLPEWNQRFAKKPASALDAHRPLRKDQKLASILSHVEVRTMGNDYTLRWFGKRYQLPKASLRPRMRKAKLRVEQRLNGDLTTNWEGAEIRLHVCQPEAEPAQAVAPPRQAKTPRSQSRRWMDGFWAGNPDKKRPVPPVTPVALRAPSVTGGTG